MEKTFDIKEELKKLPDAPGVYIMHDKDDVIILQLVSGDGEASLQGRQGTARGPGHLRRHAALL